MKKDKRMQTFGVGGIVEVVKNCLKLHWNKTIDLIYKNCLLFIHLLDFVPAPLEIQKILLLKNIKMFLFNPGMDLS